MLLQAQVTIQDNIQFFCSLLYVGSEGPSDVFRANNENFCLVRVRFQEVSGQPAFLCHVGSYVVKSNLQVSDGLNDRYSCVYHPCCYGRRYCDDGLSIPGVTCTG